MALDSSDRLRVAVGTGTFPCLSETFIVQQLIELLDLGHDVQIFAERRGRSGEPVHPAVLDRDLQGRTVYLDMPEDAEAELPVRPLADVTWPPGASTPVRNVRRVADAIPPFWRAAVAAPRVTAEVLNPGEWGYRAESLSGLYRLAALCRLQRPVDVVHVHFGPVADNVRFVRRLWRAPLVVSFHGYDFSQWPSERPSRVYGTLFEHANLITVASEHARSRLLDLGAPEHLLRLLPMGLTPAVVPFRERRAGPGGEVRLVSVARLVPKKGISAALRAVAELAPDHPELRYDVVGDGPERSALGELARDLGIASRVTFHGAAAPRDVQRHLDRAHIFVMASTGLYGDEEGQGLVLQEAQLSGLPVVATDHGPLKEGFLPDRSGVLVAENDVAALTAGLRTLLDAPHRWPEMGRCGRAFVAGKYDARALAQQLVAIYQEARMRGAVG